MKLAIIFTCIISGYHFPAGSVELCGSCLSTTQFIRVLLLATRMIALLLTRDAKRSVNWCHEKEENNNRKWTDSCAFFSLY